MFRNLAFPFLLAALASVSCYAQQTESAPAALVTSSSPADSPSSSKVPSHAKSEDWSRIQVDRSILKPLLNGAPLGKMEASAYSRELVRLEWRHGDSIDLYIVKPHGVDKPRPVLYLYSYPSDNDRFMDDGWCTRATREGLAAVGFVTALTGYRFRNRPMKEWFVSELQESLGSSTHDVQLILDYLASRDDLSADQVGIFGQGSGGAIAILAAAADPRIRALDLLNPWGEWSDWLRTSPVVPDEERPRYLTPEFLQKVSLLDPVAYLPALQDRSVRVQQIMDDPAMPAEPRDKFAAAVPHGQLVQFKDAAAHREAWKITGLSGWLAARLSPKASSPAPRAN